MKNEETHSCFFITTIVHAEVEVPNHVSFTVGGAPSSIVIRFHLRHCLSFRSILLFLPVEFSISLIFFSSPYRFNPFLYSSFSPGHHY
jgi:hypothetical protein